jgi:putative flavoprotein involved in K+ transport
VTVGLPWQHTRGSPLLGFVADEAAHVTAQLARTTAAAGAPTPQP